MRRFALAWLLANCGACAFRPGGLNVQGADLAAGAAVGDMAQVFSVDMSSPSASVDLAQPLPPDLAQPLDMTPTPHYRDAIQGILDARGCTAASCHQAYAPLVIPTPKTDPQWQQNWTNVLADVTTNCDMGSVSGCASSSLLLNKPLLGSSVTHAGGVKPFASTLDPDYVLIFEWIEEGAKL